MEKDLVMYRAFVDEMIKIAVTRSQREWRKEEAARLAAEEGGHTAYQQKLVDAHRKLKLRPRYLKDISRGGEEAGVDLMMGDAGNKALPGGYTVRKLY